ncbi:MAG TPA: serine/threonine-protein kinase, partial [Urbifossiella sp.]|nr:serine/threonine-protein kinase [Urbifossiella sp.]
MTPSLPPGDALRSGGEDVIRRFESAWRGPDRPDLADFLPAGPQPPDLLLELVHVDLEFRFRAGDDARVEEYVARFPGLAADALFLDLIRAEFALRARYRPPVTPDDFRRRFPERAGEFDTPVFDPKRSGGLTPTGLASGPTAPLTVVPTVPGYEILGELGRGGMGVVYKAADRALRRTVAIKTLGSVPAADNRARFAREAEAIAALDHPHIVPVYEVGEWRAAGLPPVPYFVMKYYPGGSLDAARAGPGTDLVGHARTVETVARAVHHAHLRGVLHRDLKPPNILLDEAGGAHVADFGLAGRFDPADPGSLTAAVVGTPAYMAPEQAHAPKEVTTAADVYGLGAVLYHQLTGRPPFHGSTPLSTLAQAAGEPPTRPALVNPAVPRDLETICLKCLEKEPARRYATAADLAADLERWRTGRPILARPARAWERAWWWTRQHPVLAAMGAATAAAVLLAVVALAENFSQSQAKQQEATAAYLRENGLRSELADALTREHRTLYLERVGSAGRFVAANQLPRAWRLLEQCPAELRGWEWKYLDGVRRATPGPWEGHADAVGAAAYLADGRLVTADLGGQARVWEPTGHTARTWTAGPGRVTELAAHPARPWVAAASRFGVDVWDADAGTRVLAVPRAGRAAFSPCGRWLATADAEAVRLWGLPGWEKGPEIAGQPAEITALTFTPDGEHLVIGNADGTVQGWTTKDGWRAGAPLKRPRAVTGLAYTADGKTLVESHAEGVELSDPKTGKHRARVGPAAAGRAFAAVGPRPDLVAVVGPDREVIVWDWTRNRPVRTYRGHTAGVAALAFSPDGTRRASAGGDLGVRVWDLRTEPGAGTAGGFPAAAGTVAAAADGSRVAVAPPFGAPPAEHRIAVFDAASQPVRAVPGTGDAALSRDGRR